jgi:hypothetical protein
MNKKIIYYTLFISLIFTNFYPDENAWAQGREEPASDDKGSEEVQSEPGKGLFYIEAVVDASAEMYFFNTIDLKDASKLKDSSDDEVNVTYNFKGRKKKMDYSISPVYLACVKAYLTWSFLSFDSAYKTDRVWKGGGTIEKGDEAIEKLSSNKTVSEILKIGVGVFGFNTSFRIVNFNFGEARVFRANDDVYSDKPLYSAPLTLDITEVDLRYDFGYRKAKGKIKKRKGGLRYVKTAKETKKWYQPFVGYKYLNYQLPRILYKMEDRNGDPEKDDWFYLNESEPQLLKTELHMIGAGFEDLRHREKKRLKFVYSTALYFGAGGTSFNFKGKSSDETEPLLGILFNFQPGISIKISEGFLDTNLRLMYDMNAMYYMIPEGGSLVSSSDSENDLGTKMYTFGQIDLYHGFNFAFQAQW